MKRKILHILGSLNIGGAENLVLDLARHALSDGAGNIEFHLVYMHRSNADRVELFNEAFAGRVQYIPCNKGGAATLKFIRLLRKYIAANGIEQIHCHNNIDAYWAALASLFTGVKKQMLSVHGMNLNFRFLAGKMGCMQKMEKSLLSKMEIKYVSSVTKEFYEQQYGFRELSGEIIYNGVDWSRFMASSKQTNIKGEPWQQQGKPIFLMAGSFSPDSRLQSLICRALAQISMQEGELPFIFLFAGAQHPKYPELFEECVEICREGGLLDKEIFFLGARRDVPAIMAAASGYVYASQKDTFGLSVIEAAGYGLPVICSDIPALREVLEGGRFGKLLPNTQKDFAREIKALYAAVSSGNGQEEVQNNKAEQVRELYSIENCFANYYNKNW